MGFFRDGSFTKGIAMLVLSRQEFEAITIGDDITVTVVEIDEARVRLGIDAPIEVPVHRREVYDAIKRGAQE
jgi:carbon storage regulator